jgi:hypothetical protein
MKQAFVLISSAVVGLSMSACSGSTPDGGGDGGDDDGQICSAAITAAPANNYQFHSTLSFPPVSVMPDAELTFDWSAVTTDFLGRPLDPRAGVDAVNLLLWTLTPEELQVKLNADDLSQRNLAVIATYYTEKMATTANVFQLTSVGMPLTRCDILPFLQLPNPDPNGHPECPSYAQNVGAGFDQTANTYTVMVASGTVLGAGTRMIQAFKLDPTSTNTTIAVRSDSTVLDWSVNMHDLTPTRVPRATGNITIDWSGMTVNSSGNTFNPSDITEALIAHYTQPVSELEAQFLNLDLLPAERWRGTIDAGTNVNLSSFTNEAGQAFAGVDGTGTWVLALICGDCRNPAPWYLTTLSACGQ